MIHVPKLSQMIEEEKDQLCVFCGRGKEYHAELLLDLHGNLLRIDMGDLNDVHSWFPRATARRYHTDEEIDRLDIK